MPPDPALKDAAEDEIQSLAPDNFIISCRVKIVRYHRRSSNPVYDVQVAMLAGSRMFVSDGHLTWSRHIIGPWFNNQESAEHSLRRAFAKIHSQLDRPFSKVREDTLEKRGVTRSAMISITAPLSTPQS